MASVVIREIVSDDCPDRLGGGPRMKDEHVEASFTLGRIIVRPAALGAYIGRQGI
jgi:hypothetical protein